MSLEPQKQQIPTNTDTDVKRCPYCQTMLVQQTISVMATETPFIPVSKAVICFKCHYLAGGYLLPMAGKLGITKEGLKACLKATKNASAFNLSELQSGVMRPVKFSASLKKIFDKQANEKAEAQKPLNYDPNRFIEPKAVEELPF